MTKQEHIHYWIEVAERDWTAVQHLFSSGDFVHSLFFAHLAVEKLSKAAWVRDNEENVPPRVHNILKLLINTKIELSAGQKEFIVRLNSFQMEGRYPDYKRSIYKLCTKDYTSEILTQVNELRLCLLNNLR